MSGAMIAGNAAVAAHRANIANAIKACGVIVSVTPFEFVNILARMEDPLIVGATGGLFSAHYKYLTTYRGLTFYCKSSTPLDVPMGAEIVEANKISIPDL